MQVDAVADVEVGSIGESAGAVQSDAINETHVTGAHLLVERSGHHRHWLVNKKMVIEIEISNDST